MYSFVFISLKQYLKQYFDLVLIISKNSNKMSLHRIYKTFSNQSLIQYIITFLYGTDAIADCRNALNFAAPVA